MGFVPSPGTAVASDIYSTNIEMHASGMLAVEEKLKTSIASCNLLGVLKLALFEAKVGKVGLFIVATVEKEVFHKEFIIRIYHPTENIGKKGEQVAQSYKLLICGEEDVLGGLGRHCTQALHLSGDLNNDADYIEIFDYFPGVGDLIIVLNARVPEFNVGPFNNPAGAT